MALLRGINVGGKNRLAMADLAKCFEAAGAANVRTFIQSGNVVFAASSEAAGVGIAQAASAGLLRVHGLRVPIITRTAAAMARIINASPLAVPAMPEEQRFIAFLASTPTPAAAAALAPARSPGDTFVLIGADLHLRITTSAARTKLTTAYFDSTLATTATMRNWRTVAALADLAGG
ncbi:MAG: DUF1697 domain-containing protein [Phycisphaerales bacterium]